MSKVDMQKHEKLCLATKKRRMDKELYWKSIELILDKRMTSITTRPKVSFILIGYKEGPLFLRCLDSIVNQKDGSEFEIIVVDNGLDQEVIDSVKKYNLLYIKTKANVGASSGRNIAAIYAMADILASIDSDGYIDFDYFEAAIKLMDNKKIVAARGKVLPVDDIFLWKAKPKHYDLGNYESVSLIDIEGNLIIRREDYLNVGGMEDGLYGHEGAVLCCRMIEFYGYERDQFYYSPDLVLYHDYQSSFSSIYEKLMRYKILLHKIQLQYPSFQKMIDYYMPLRKNRERISFLNLLLKIQEKIAAKKFNKESEKYLQRKYDRNKK